MTANNVNVANKGNKEMTPMQRLLTALNHNEPDRVPMFLLATMHGAKELNLSIETYYSKPEYVVEGQLRLWEKYRSDCLYPFYFAGVETSAWGGEIIFRPEGPPTVGRPFLQDYNGIRDLTVPDVADVPMMQIVLRTIESLKAKVGDEIPIIGVVISPMSLPIIQMGFEPYLNLIRREPELFQLLIEKNIDFAVAWANAQIDAGAAAICYFDPVSSPTIFPVQTYIDHGFPTAKKTLGRIKSHTATHLASGRTLPIADLVAQTGTAIIGVSTHESLAECKKACRNKITVLGNLNGVEMRRWTPEEAEQKVKNAIAAAGEGGGFILADTHGEIPFQVPDSVLLAISKAVRKWGQYPLEWVRQHEK